MDAVRGLGRRDRTSGKARGISICDGEGSGSGSVPLGRPHVAFEVHAHADPPPRPIISGSAQDVRTSSGHGRGAARGMPMGVWRASTPSRRRNSRVLCCPPERMGGLPLAETPAVAAKAKGRILHLAVFPCFAWASGRRRWTGREFQQRGIAQERITRWEARWFPKRDRASPVGRRRGRAICGLTRVYRGGMQPSRRLDGAGLAMLPASAREPDR